MPHSHFNLAPHATTGPVRAVVLMLPGLRAAAREWQPVAAMLAAEGVALEALPLWGQAGHHASGPRSLRSWPEDGDVERVIDDAIERINRAVDDVRARLGAVTIALAGHSFGAYVALRALERESLRALSIDRSLLWLVNPTIAPRQQLRGAARAAVLLPRGCKFVQHLFGRVAWLWRLWPLIQPLPGDDEPTLAGLTHEAYRAVHPGTYRVLADAPAVTKIPSRALVHVHLGDSIVDPAPVLAALGGPARELDRGDHNPHQDPRAAQQLVRELVSALDLHELERSQG
jgi:pimeloyl-ACP methyl ester carboxylesterase